MEGRKCNIRFLFFKLKEGRAETETCLFRVANPPDEITDPHSGLP